MNVKTRARRAVCLRADRNTHSRRSVFIVVVLGLLTILGHAQQKNPDLVLTIDRLDPEIPIENRELNVFFSLQNFSGQPTNGTVAAMILPGEP